MAPGKTIDKGFSNRIILKDQGYYDRDYSAYFLNALEQIRLTGNLYDVTLLCGHEEFHAHKVVLAAASSYFHAMFTGGMREAMMPIIELREVDPTALGALLQYAYSGIINLDGSNIQCTLEAADLLQFQSAVDLCVNYITSHLDSHNCVEVFQLAEKLANTDLKGYARHVINKNFSQVVKQQAFLKLDVKCLSDILSDDGISVCSETDVLHAILSWLSYAEMDRLYAVSELLSVVRTYYIGPKAFKDFIDIVEQRYSPLVVPFLEDMLCSIKGLSCVQQPMRKSYEVWLHVLGGEKSFLNEVASIECLENGKKSWSSQELLRYPKAAVAVVFLDGKLFVIGGMNGSSKLRSVEIYNPDTNVWTTAAPLSKCCGDVSAAVLAGMIYVAGGSTDRAAVCKFVETYDHRTNTWHMLGKMNCKRRKFCLVPFEQNLYALGGLNDREGGLNSVESLAAGHFQWQRIAPMAMRRYDFGAVVLSEHIYVVGGANGTMGSMNLVEKYSPETNTWTGCSPMLNCRGGLSVGVYCGRIMAISGIDSYMSVVNTVESYDETTDEWTMMDSTCTGRSASAAILLPFKMP